MIIIAIILGLVEGITEFLPISSTAHLILVGNFLSFKGPFATLFEIVIQLGAILAVIVYYRKRIFDSVSKLKPGEAGYSFWTKVLIAFAPAAVIGFFAKDTIEKYLFSLSTVGIALFIGAILMLVVEKYHPAQQKTIAHIGYKQVFFIGMMQCMALFPGMSRSASTMIGGMLVGLTLTEAAEFSFFLAIPTMLGATTLSLLHGISALTMPEWSMLGIGFVVSFITALVVIDQFIAFLVKYSLKPFAYYRLVIGILIFVFMYAGLIFNRS